MKILDTNKLAELADGLVKAGWRVVVPVEHNGAVTLDDWRAGATLCLDRFAVNSLKDVLLPRGEVIARFRADGNDFHVADVTPRAPKTVVLACRPCDVAGLALLDTVFNWDFKDDFYNARRAATTVVPLVCTKADDFCFCTSVGGAPDSTAGADAVLRLADGGAALALEPVSGKGGEWLAAAGAWLRDGDVRPEPPASVARQFDMQKVRKWLDTNFDSPLWGQWSLGCLGCSACSSGCPTCHCFDIQDEKAGAEILRFRKQDSCGQAVFTQHAGGHNPRGEQSCRRRQRVLHKFSYIPQRFSLLGCTGCGRCGRVCQSGLDMADACMLIDKIADTATPSPAVR